MRTSFGVDADVVLLGVVGDVIRRKGLNYLIDSLPRIISAVPNVRLLVVGRQDEPFADQVKAQVQRLRLEHRVIWEAPRDDIPEVMSALDLYVLPSNEETLPLSAIEAMASGLPVVASGVGGLSECVVPGVTGNIVPPANPGALATAIIDLLSDPQRRADWGTAGKHRVAEHFSVESQLPRIENALALVVREATQRISQDDQPGADAAADARYYQFTLPRKGLKRT